MVGNGIYITTQPDPLETRPTGNPSDGKPVRRETRPTESQGEINNNVHSNNICNKKQQQEENVAAAFLENINSTLKNKTVLDYNTKSSKLISSLMDLKTEELSRFIKNFGGSSANWGFLIQNPKKIEQFLKEKSKKEHTGNFCQTTGQEFEIFGG